MIMQQRNENQAVRKEKRDLEEYLDNLLLRVMEVQPHILQHPSQRPPPSNPTPTLLTASEKQALMLDVAKLTPAYPPPAYSHLRTEQQQQQQVRGKTTAKSGKSSSTTTTTSANQKRDRKSSNPFKRLSNAFSK